MILAANLQSREGSLEMKNSFTMNEKNEGKKPSYFLISLCHCIKHGNILPQGILLSVNK